MGKNKNRSKQFHLENSLLRALFRLAPKPIFFFPPNSSFFHFLHAFGEQKNDFKRPTFIA